MGSRINPNDAKDLIPVPICVVTYAKQTMSFAKGTCEQTADQRGFWMEVG